MEFGKCQKSKGSYRLIKKITKRILCDNLMIKNIHCSVYRLNLSRTNLFIVQIFSYYCNSKKILRWSKLVRRVEAKIEMWKFLFGPQRPGMESFA